MRVTRRELPHLRRSAPYATSRFILISIYTVTRAGAIAATSPELGRSFVDLERGIFYRKQIGKRATKKRQTPAPIPPRLLAHMRRWKTRKPMATCFVESSGKPVASVKTRFRSAAKLAELSGRVAPRTPPAHRGNLVDAAGCADLGNGRVPWHVSRGPAGQLRTPTP